MSETPDQAATRRRWITLAEAVAVAGLLIAALSLYLGWSDRRADDADRRADQAQARANAAQERRHVGLIATDADGDVLSFKGVACALQTTDISFPSALGVETHNTVLEHRIEGDWFKKPLLKLIEPAKATRGRLPVLIASRCATENGDRLEEAIYDVPYRTESRFLRGKAIRLNGLVLREYVAGAKGRTRLDAIWSSVAPKPKK